MTGASCWPGHFIALRVEWCKARARAHRWEEEVQLLQEEMCCIVAFLDWQAGWWDMQGPRRAFNSLQAGEGALAYAQRQANLRRQMVIHIKSVWAANPSWQEAPLLAVHLHSELPMPNSHSPVRSSVCHDLMWGYNGEDDEGKYIIYYISVFTSGERHA